nr:divalent metal cation transporter [Cupriavidus basilensis]
MLAASQLLEASVKDVASAPQEPELSWLGKLGPGLITGAADDDPSGIATYSQAGAQFGFNMLWTVLLTYPLMVGIQVVSARIGRVSGHGLATNIRRHYPAWLLYAVVFGAISLLLQVFVPYRRYVRLLKWLTLAMLAYVATAFVVHIPWSQVLSKALLPHMGWLATLMMALAVCAMLVTMRA